MRARSVFCLHLFSTAKPFPSTNGARTMQDHVIECGDKFWTGAKRFPRAAEADNNMAEEQHKAFVMATANLLAAGCGLTPQEEGLLPEDHPQRDVGGKLPLNDMTRTVAFWLGELGNSGASYP